MAAKETSLLRNAAYFGIGLACTGAGWAAARSRRRSQWARGKVVVITGASRGLGLALAEEFGRRGARLVLAARDAGELLRARRKLLSLGVVRDEEDVLIVPADLRKSEEAEGLIDEATRQFGRVDVLINNAGVITVGPIENQTIEHFRDVMESNFFTGLHCTLSVLPQMLERGTGAIANVTSIGGKVAVPHLLPYTASKFASVGFSEGLGDGVALERHSCDHDLPRADADGLASECTLHRGCIARIPVVQPGGESARRLDRGQPRRTSDCRWNRVRGSRNRDYTPGLLCGATREPVAGTDPPCDACDESPAALCCAGRIYNAPRRGCS